MPQTTITRTEVATHIYRDGRLHSGAFYSTGDNRWHAANPDGLVGRYTERATAERVLGAESAK